jgi:hypothetical protein
MKVHVDVILNETFKQEGRKILMGKVKKKRALKITVTVAKRLNSNTFALVRAVISHSRCST